MAKINVEKELELFTAQPKFQTLGKFEQNVYTALYRRLREAENISNKEVLERFKYAKPLVRLRQRNSAYGTDSAPECLDNRCKVLDGKKPGDLLAWAITGNLNDNFVKEFDNYTVLRYGKEILSVGKLQEMTQFTVYAEPYIGCNGERLIDVDTATVLRQLPPEVSPQEQYAFELKVPSGLVSETLWDELLQRHAVKVNLYRVVKGYSPKIAKIKEICRPVSFTSMVF